MVAPAPKGHSEPCSTGIAATRQRSMPPARFASSVKPVFCSSMVAWAERTGEFNGVAHVDDLDFYDV